MPVTAHAAAMPAGVEVATDPTAYMPTSMAAAKLVVTNLAAEDIRCRYLLFYLDPGIVREKDEWGLITQFDFACAPCKTRLSSSTAR
jgi:hypothetical protein